MKYFDLCSNAKYSSLSLLIRGDSCFDGCHKAVGGAHVLAMDTNVRNLEDGLRDLSGEKRLVGIEQSTRQQGLSCLPATGFFNGM